jgi:replicative superfamily II helicase
MLSQGNLRVKENLHQLAVLDLYLSCKVLINKLCQQVRLLIIDEVHLLDEERGAVIETIVARTLRQERLA